MYGTRGAKRPRRSSARSSLARAVTQTCVPFAAVTTRTGWQPASTVATTECAGSVSARCKSISVSVPAGSSGTIPARAAWLAERAGPPADALMPTGC